MKTAICNIIAFTPCFIASLGVLYGWTKKGEEKDSDIEIWHWKTCRQKFCRQVFAKTFLPEKIPAYYKKVISESEENSNGKQKYYEKNKESKKKLFTH